MHSIEQKLVKTFTLLQKKYISNKCHSFELSIYQRILKTV